VKKILIALLAVIVVAVAAAVALPFLIPLDTYKRQITERVRDATGRELRIGGDIKFSLLPRIEVAVHDVTFANAPGSATRDMVKLTRLDLQVQMLPLLSGNIAVDRFVLVDPQINLEIDKQGRANWVFGETTPSRGKPTPTESKGGGIAGIKLGDVRLVNGAIAYADARSGAKQRIDKINVRLSLPDMDGPFAAKGEATWNGQKVELDIGAANAKALMLGQATAVNVALTSEPITLAFKGSAATADAAKVDGDVDLKVPSVRRLAAWLGQPIEAPGSGLGPLTIAGKLSAAGPRVTFKEAKLGLDAIRASGEIMIDGGRARPFLKGKLDVAALDVNPYLPPETAPGPAPKAPPAPAAPAAASAEPGTWSDQPIDLSGLRAADAEFDLSVGQIQVRKISIGRSVLAAKLAGGRLALDLRELNLYQGNGQGRLVLDGSGAVPGFEHAFRLSRLQAQPFLRDAADFERLVGVTEGEIEFTARGRSQREMVSALNGKGKLSFRDGAIKGINLGAMVRNVATAFLDAGAGAQQQTDFAELSGSFVVANGQFRNDDLLLQSPLLRLTGAGKSDMPKRTLDYRLDPKLAATTAGQGGSKDVAGISVPVLIQGPWHDLKYRPDVGGAIKEQLKDPGGAVRAIQGIVGGKPKAGEAPAAGTAPAPAAPGNPLDALKGLFKKN
jgi:AsmA protein